MERNAGTKLSKADERERRVSCSVDGQRQQKERRKKENILRTMLRHSNNILATVALCDFVTLLCLSLSCCHSAWRFSFLVWMVVSLFLSHSFGLKEARAQQPHRKNTATWLDCSSRWFSFFSHHYVVVSFFLFCCCCCWCRTVLSSGEGWLLCTFGHFCTD